MGRLYLNGERINELLDQRNRDQQWLAYQSKVSLRQINRVINGGSTTARTRDRLAATLGVPWEEITLPGGAAVAIGRIPHKPPKLIGRDELLREVVGRLKAFSRREAEEEQNVLSLYGPPGRGKTRLAVESVYNEAVQKAFPDGVYWRTLGKKPDLLGILQRWCADLGVPRLLESCLKSYLARLGKKDILELTKEEDHALAGEAGWPFRAYLLQSGKRCLFVLDDCWDAEHASPLTVGGGRCATILTTRHLPIAERFTPTGPIPVPRLEREDALKLLEQRAGTDTIARHHEACRELIQRLEGLPLAIVVAGAKLRRAVSHGDSVENVIHELKERTDKLLHEPVPQDVEQFLHDTENPTVVALLQMSTDELDDETRECFAALGDAIPSEEATFDLDRMAGGWGLSRERAQAVADTLIDHGLMEPADELLGVQRYRMHDLFIQHAKTLFEEE